MRIIRGCKKYPFVILCIFSSCLLMVKLLGVTINITPSMKKGIYIGTYGEIKKGDIVAACLVDPYKAIGLRQNYIERGTRCDGSDPIIKQVVAVPGDDVELTYEYIIVNNIRLPFKTGKKDSAGRNLNIYPRSKYLNTNGYWLIGTNSLNSWDSRYWGPVLHKQVLYKLKLLM